MTLSTLLRNTISHLILQSSWSLISWKIWTSLLFRLQKTWMFPIQPFMKRLCVLWIFRVFPCVGFSVSMKSIWNLMRITFIPSFSWTGKPEISLISFPTDSKALWKAICVKFHVMNGMLLNILFQICMTLIPISAGRIPGSGMRHPSLTVSTTPNQSSPESTAISFR